MIKGSQGYGFSINGDSPVFVRTVTPDGTAHRAGLKVNDIILKVNGTKCPLGPRERVVALIKVSMQAML